jgi:leader peptidase (prepilin peptidase)/N-methyltransferase
MLALRLLLAFAAGAVVASTLDAAVWRARHGLSFVTGRSACEQCRHRLGALDLIPVVSWLALRGRCRYCRARLAARHVAGELAGGAAVALCLLWLAQ